MAAIELDHVTKRFPDGTVAVNDVELTVEDGEIMIGGRVVNDVEPPDRDVAMVFQNYALYPHMSVHDNIGFPLRMQRVPRSQIHERVAEAGKMLGIDELLQRK